MVDAHLAYRVAYQEAVAARCRFNDIVVIAIEDILLKKQALPGAPSRLDL